MKCYYHESSDVMGQCPSCSKFLCKTCLDEYGTNFCTDCTKKRYRQFCEEFKDKLNTKINWQKEKIQLAKSAWNMMMMRSVLFSIIGAPFMAIPMLMILFFPVSFLLYYPLIFFDVSEPIDISLYVVLILSLPLSIYLIVCSTIANSGAQLHRELKEKDRTEKKTIDFSPEIQAIFSELRLVATSVSPFGRDQIYEEPGESNVYFARLKRSLVLRFSFITAPKIYKKIKETRQQLADELQKLQQVKPPSFEKFVSVQRTLLAEEKQKPIIPDV